MSTSVVACVSDSSRVSLQFDNLTFSQKGTKDEDEQLTQMLQEEEAQMSRKIVALREDVRRTDDIVKVEMC